jgi:hypothetical protein
MYGFGDISKDNIMIIASVFDKETGHAVQTAEADPTSATSQLYEFILSRPMIRVFQFIMDLGISNSIF